MRSTWLAIVLIGSRIRFRLVLKSVTSNELERRNVPYFFHRTRQLSGALRPKVIKDKRKQSATAM